MNKQNHFCTGVESHRNALVAAPFVHTPTQGPSVCVSFCIHAPKHPVITRSRSPSHHMKNVSGDVEPRNLSCFTKGRSTLKRLKSMKYSATLDTAQPYTGSLTLHRRQRIRFLGKTSCSTPLYFVMGENASQSNSTNAWTEQPHKQRDEACLLLALFSRHPQ